MIRSNSSSIQCLVDISVNEGFDIICREGSIGQGGISQGLVKIPQGSCEVLVMRPIDQ